MEIEVDDKEKFVRHRNKYSGTDIDEDDDKERIIDLFITAVAKSQTAMRMRTPWKLDTHSKVQLCVQRTLTTQNTVQLESVVTSKTSTVSYSKMDDGLR